MNKCRELNSAVFVEPQSETTQPRTNDPFLLINPKIALKSSNKYIMSASLQK